VHPPQPRENMANPRPTGLGSGQPQTNVEDAYRQTDSFNWDTNPHTLQGSIASHVTNRTQHASHQISSFILRARVEEDVLAKIVEGARGVDLLVLSLEEGLGVGVLLVGLLRAEGDRALVEGSSHLPGSERQ